MQSAFERDDALAMLELRSAATRTAALSPTTYAEHHSSDQHPA